ncbi:MAG: hypothetical protein QN122_12465 [Armatimonadota bacterium]|nr:hypothetical protein [Armatimonadota bacterium]
MAESSLAVIVQAHPARREAASGLAQSLGGLIAWDPEPGGPPSTWRSYRVALASVPPWAEHALVIQDDAAPAPGLLAGARERARERPDALVALCVTRHHPGLRRAVEVAYGLGQRWLSLRPYVPWVPTVALLWPSWAARAVLSWAEERRLGPIGADDGVVGMAAACLGLQAVAAVPSLVEHPDLLPSLMRPRWRGPDPSRQAVVVETRALEKRSVLC